MKTALMVLILAAAAIAADPAAQDITLTDGTVFKSATVKGNDGYKVTIAHDEGIGKYAIEDIAEKSRKDFGIIFDPEKAAEVNFASRLAEDKRRAAAALSTQRANIGINIQSVLTSLSGTYMNETGTGILISTRKGEYGTEILHLVGKFGKPVSHDRIEVRGLEAGTFEYITVLGAKNRIRQFRCDIDAAVEEILSGKLPGYSALLRPPTSNAPVIRATGVPPLRNY